MGFGFKTTVPCYSRDDLIHRLLFLLKQEPEFVPQPKVEGCKVTSTAAEAKSILMTGKGKINIIGEMKKVPSKHTIYIKGWTPRLSFEKLLEKINKFKGYNLLENGDVGWTDETTKQTGTNVAFTVTRTQKKDEIYKKLDQTLTNCLSASIGYNITVIGQDGEVRVAGVDEMLKICFVNYVKALQTSFQEEIIKLKATKEEFRVIEVIRPYVHLSASSSELLKIIQTGKERLKLFSGDFTEREIQKLNSITIIEENKI